MKIVQSRRLPFGIGPPSKKIEGREEDLGRVVPTGIYIARLVTPDYTKSIKMLLLR